MTSPYLPTLDPACPINWSHPLNRGLIAEWSVTPLAGWRGGLIWRDLVRGGKLPHDGTLNSGASWVGTRSKPGSYGAINFDGATGNVNAGNVPVGGLTSLTISAWVYARTTGGANFGRIMGKGVTDPFLLVIQGSTSVTFYINGNSVVQDAAGFSLNAWHHIAAVYRSGGTSTIYVDGIARLTGTATGALTSNGSVVDIGNQDGLDRGFDGYIDNASIYNRALTAADVAALYSETKQGNPNRWNWINGATYFLPPTPVSSAASQPVLDVTCPINWSNPLNRNLMHEWAATPMSGWRGAAYLDLVRGAKPSLDGTLTSGASWSATSRPNGFGSISFDGTNDYVKVPASTGMQNLTTYTVSAWFRTSASPTTQFLTDWNGNNVSKFRMFVGVFAGKGTANKLTHETYYTGGSHYTDVTSSASVNDGLWHQAVAINDGSNISLYIDGVLAAGPSAVQAGNITSESDSFFIGVSGFNSSPSGSTFFNGNLDGVKVHSSALNAGQVQALYKEEKQGNPTRWNWISQPQVIPGSGSTSYTLTASNGSFTLTGQAATFGKGFTASNGSFTLTGEAATFNVGLTASQGSFTLTGEAATFNTGLTAAQGSFSLTGEAVTFTVGTGFAISAAAGTFILTGETATFGVGLATSAGSFTLTGEAAVLDVGLTASRGTFALTGEAVTFSRAFSASNGTFVLTGEPATFTKTLHLTAAYGVFNLTGEPVTFFVSQGNFIIVPISNRTLSAVIPNRSNDILIANY